VPRLPAEPVEIARPRKMKSRENGCPSGLSSCAPAWLQGPVLAGPQGLAHYERRDLLGARGHWVAETCDLIATVWARPCCRAGVHSHDFSLHQVGVVLVTCTSGNTTAQSSVISPGTAARTPSWRRTWTGYQLPPDCSARCRGCRCGMPPRIRGPLYARDVRKQPSPRDSSRSARAVSRPARRALWSRERRKRPRTGSWRP